MHARLSTALIEIAFAIHDDRVLAAHLGDHALDPDLALLRLGGQFVDAQADVARSGEGDEARLRMLHQNDRRRRRRCRSAARRLRGGKPASSSTSANFAAMVGVSLEGLMTTVLPVTSAATVMPARIASGKFHGGITTPDAQRQIDHFIALAGHLHHGLRAGQAQHLARVVFAEIDGFGDFGFGFGPGLAGFEHQPGVELELALAQNRARRRAVMRMRSSAGVRLHSGK